MAESNNTDGGGAPDSAAGAGDAGLPTGGRLRMWLSGLVFVVFAVVTFIAGEDNRWVSIPAAIVAAVALIDFLSINQRRRRMTM